MAAHARARTRPAPRHHRRISGPAVRPVPAGAPLRRGSTGVFERIRALPETRLVDGLLRGRVWIWLIGLMLGGIVAMQVSLLKLNAGISRAVTTASTLERQNATIESEIAKLSSIERVRDAASAEDMVAPAPGMLAYLHTRDRDARLAARRMAPPSDEATLIMENGGFEPGVLATATAPLTADPAAVATPDPTAAATETAVTPEATATPVPTATPVATATPPAAEEGAVVAPQG